MNCLSLISFFNAYSFLILAIYTFKLNSKEALNKLAAAVNICFAIWAFAYTFFYISPTENGAMFWHRVGSFGWIFNCVFATHFFLILSERVKEKLSFKAWILLYITPVLLFLKAILSSETPIAKGLIQSKSGMGWTYDLNIESMWFWLYILYIVMYYSIAFFLTYLWAKNSNKLRFLKQARSIIVIDILMIVIGFFVDIILPAIDPIMPPILSLMLIVWGIIFIYIVKNLKLMGVYDVASPDLILKTVMDPIIMLDNKGTIIACNKATEELFNYSLEQIINKPLFSFCKSEGDGEQTLNDIFKQKEGHNVPIDLLDSTGDKINALISFSVAANRLDGPVGIVLSIHDITKLKKVEQELYKRKEKYKELSKDLEKLANYDELTGIANRRLFFQKLESAIECYKKSGKKFALVFIDLDGFKGVNDSCGHDIGDMLLVRVSNMLANFIRKQDIIARIGGDEFVIIISDLDNNFNLDDTVRRMRELFFEPIHIDNHICSIGISPGISRYPEDGMTADQLISVADSRMYEDKNLKKANYLKN